MRGILFRDDQSLFGSNWYKLPKKLFDPGWPGQVGQGIGNSFRESGATQSACRL